MSKVRTAILTRWTRQSGAALLLCLFALLLLSAVAFTLYLSSGTETRIATNYGNGLDAYYSAKFGLQEVRDRVNYLSTSPKAPGGLADQLPTDIAGNPRGVLYVLNPGAVETVDPTDLASRYFDDQLCHDYASGISKTSKCNVVPGVANWALPSQTSLAPAGTASALKWVRINMKTNRTSDPFVVDATNYPATADVPVCWDGHREMLPPPGPQATCDGNGLQNVFMLTALAVSPGIRDNAGRRLLRSEVVPPSIRPAGAITMDGSSAAVQLSDGNSMPQTKVDGRPHGLDGRLQTAARCSAVAALATDQSTTSTTLMQALNTVRLGIVQSANSQCNADGTLQGSNGAQKCSANLWWVRGTDSSFRFVTSVTVTNSGSGDHHGNDGDHSGSTSQVPCDSSTANCYTNLNLGAPELSAQTATTGLHVPTITSYQDPNNPTAPFAGGPGNQADPSIYQTSLPALFTNQVQAVSTLVENSTGQANYFSVPAASLASTYGDPNNPAVVVVGGPLSLTTPLSGYGVLVVPNSLQINAGGSLQWNGIVLVRGQNSTVPEFKMGAGTGAINGALMLQPPQPTSTNPNPPQQVNVTTSASGTGAFNINYSCDAIDMAFRALSFQTVSSAEVSY